MSREKSFFCYLIQQRWISHALFQWEWQAKRMYVDRYAIVEVMLKAKNYELCKKIIEYEPISLSLIFSLLSGQSSIRTRAALNRSIS